MYLFQKNCDNKQRKEVDAKTRDYATPSGEKVLHAKGSGQLRPRLWWNGRNILLDLHPQAGQAQRSEMAGVPSLPCYPRQVYFCQGRDLPWRSQTFD